MPEKYTCSPPGSNGVEVEEYDGAQSAPLLVDVP